MIGWRRLQALACRALGALALLGALTGGAAQAQTPVSMRVGEAQEWCEAMMRGDAPHGITGVRTRHYASIVGMGATQLCGCVGERAAQFQSPQDLALDDIQWLDRVASSCMPHLGSLSDFMQQAIVAGPRYAQHPSPQLLETETKLCRAIALGRHPSPFLDSDYVQLWEKAAGLQAATLCDHCVAFTMKLRRDEAQNTQERWDAVLHEQELVHALHDCQHFTYKLPLLSK